MLEAEAGIYRWQYEKIDPAATYCSVAIPQSKRFPCRPWAPDYLGMDPRLLYVYPDGKWVTTSNAINALAQYITDARRATETPEQVAAWWDQTAAQTPVLRPFAQSEQFRLLQPDAPLTNLISNGSFEAAGDPDSDQAKRLLEDMRTFRILWNDADHCTVPGMACEGWNVVERRCSRPVEVSLDGQVRHDGDASLRVAAVGQFGGVLGCTKLPDPQARYRLSFWYRTEGGAKIRYGIMLYAIRHLPYFDWEAPEASEWTKVEVEFPVTYSLPDETTDMSISLGIGNGAPGARAWFDDVRLEMLSPAGLQ